MIELYQTFNAVLEAVRSPVGWIVTSGAIIKFLISFLKSNIKPVKLLVGIIMRAYNALPIPDLTYSQSMWTLVWFLSATLSIVDWIAGGHTWVEAIMNFGAGGIAAFGTHETLNMFVKKKEAEEAKIDASGGQSPIRTDG